MGHTSPILGKERETKILFQTLVSELKKKKSFGKNRQQQTKNSPSLVTCQGNKECCLSANQIREEESLTVSD